MNEEHGRRIPIVDRRIAQQPDAQTPPPEDEPAPTGSSVDAAATGPDPSPAGVSPTTPTDPEPVAARDAEVSPSPHEESTALQAEEVEARNDFLDDLQRLQADFDNYRKRMMREQAATAGRAKARLMEQLLPVLDAFDQALEHDDGVGGTELIYKQLRTTLEAEGLEEIPAEGVPFDPHVHDAVDSREDPSVQEIVTQSVYRRGYRMGDQVLRPAAVVVARPPEASETSEDAEG